MERIIFDDLRLTIPKDSDEMQEIFYDMLTSGETRQVISFFNPEIYLAQKEDCKYKQYFEMTNFNFIDGIGLINAINYSLKTDYSVKDRYPGTDLFSYLSKMRLVRVFLYGGQRKNTDLAKYEIMKKYENVRIAGTQDGYSDISNSELIEKINNAEPDILIVCLGFPRQEMFITENLQNINVRVVLGNGGAIDFWSLKIKRAPTYIINHGFEWLYRLIHPFTLKRFRRQIKLVLFVLRYRGKNIKIKRL